MNNVVLIGRLTKDPELRYIPGTGTPVATFTLAIDRDYTKKDGSKDTDFIPIEVMGKSAEFCANYIAKGRLVAIQGSIRVDRYQTQSGENRTFTKVSARNVQALDSNRSKSENPYVESHPGSQPSFEPSFEPNQGLDPNGFQAIDDDDIPF
ncbi:single-stranded DNA-binding protein [Intestinibacter sp.]|uniref:single-stranded DNA-binding protein n=1 Tax=Intestinibacter sp. TaxID=1965304 RepID=UPI002A74A500|nr:single-stranded DNA-binding protein [Intestinibacter sp.]MDY2737455.1 single-stranded DNA-binding protein [Intestinibacter sp.]MDY4573929.1 single-stranded DNA-binding protein [Intestinibacter sp.]